MAHDRNHFRPHRGLSGADCLNAIELSDGHKIGAWLENPLTAHGEQYVIEAVREGGEVARLWKRFCGTDVSFPNVIAAFELIDHGVEHSQSFQGCGTAFTSFEYGVTGIGDTPAEAIGDCLEQIAQDGFDTEGMEARITEQEGWEALSTTPYVQSIYGDIEEIFS